MRLVDCFSELFYYTLFLRSMEFGQVSFDDVRKHYTKLFKRIVESVKKIQASRQDFEHAFFATAAWIDETVMESLWDGRNKWMQNPLQLQLFHTTNAGEEFFIRLQGLQDKDIEVRQVYDYCLALGFRGKYFRTEDKPALDQVISENIRRINGDLSPKLPKLLFPESYVWEFDKPPKPKSLTGNIALIVTAIILPLIVLGGLYIYFDESLTTLVLEYFNTGLSL